MEVDFGLESTMKDKDNSNKTEALICNSEKTDKDTDNNTETLKSENISDSTKNTEPDVTEKENKCISNNSREEYTLIKSECDKDQEQSASSKEEGRHSGKPKQRLCPGHERALPIQQTVMELDVKEEG